MALRTSYTNENLVTTDPLVDKLSCRTVGGSTVVKREVSKAYRYVGMTRRAAELCAKAKDAQYFRAATTVTEDGVLVTNPAKCLADIDIKQIAGDDFGVEVSLNYEEERIVGVNQTVSNVFADVRRMSCDDPVIPYGRQLYIPEAQYGTDNTIIGYEGKGFILLGSGYQHSCFDADQASLYEPVIEWHLDSVADGSWTGSAIVDQAWTHGGIRFINIPSFTFGQLVLMRLNVRSKTDTAYGWRSNVIAQHWIPSYATSIRVNPNEV